MRQKWRADMNISTLLDQAESITSRESIFYGTCETIAAVRNEQPHSHRHDIGGAGSAARAFGARRYRSREPLGPEKLPACLHHHDGEYRLQQPDRQPKRALH